MERPYEKCCICKKRKCYEDQLKQIWGICEHCKDIISQEWF